METVFNEKWGNDQLAMSPADRGGSMAWRGTGHLSISALEILSLSIFGHSARPGSHPSHPMALPHTAPICLFFTLPCAAASGLSQLPTA